MASPGLKRRSPSRLDQKVVVITGGSAGVGRAAAAAFAREGANLCLIARDSEALRLTQRELEAEGARILTIAADVADPEAVFSAAETCEAELGPIDIWVNNAMATVFGQVEEVTPEEFRRVTEVTYLGYVHGTLAALRHMRPRDRGVIIQVGSALAYRGIPLQAAYCGAKHAIRGFTDSLRTELVHARSRVRVTAVHLPAINTSQFDWARTHRLCAPRPVAPVYAPEAAARAIVYAALHSAREYWIGAQTGPVILGDALAPALADRYLAATAVGGQDGDAAVAPGRSDNLFQPVSGGHRTHGSFTAESRSGALRLHGPSARAGAAALLTALAAAGGALAVAGVQLAASRRRAAFRS